MNPYFLQQVAMERELQIRNEMKQRSKLRDYEEIFNSRPVTRSPIVHLQRMFNWLFVLTQRSQS